eukprot:gene2411-2875_t
MQEIDGQPDRELEQKKRAQEQLKKFYPFTLVSSGLLLFASGMMLFTSMMRINSMDRMLPGILAKKTGTIVAQIPEGKLFFYDISYSVAPNVTKVGRPEEAIAINYKINDKINIYVGDKGSLYYHQIRGFEIFWVFMFIFTFCVPVICCIPCVGLISISIFLFIQQHRNRNKNIELYGDLN